MPSFNGKKYKTIQGAKTARTKFIKKRITQLETKEQTDKIKERINKLKLLLFYDKEQSKLEQKLIREQKKTWTTKLCY